MSHPAGSHTPIGDQAIGRPARLALGGGAAGDDRVALPFPSLVVGLTVASARDVASRRAL